MPRRKYIAPMAPTAPARQPQFPANGHIQVLRSRYIAPGSKWRNRGDVFINSPAEWTDCLSKAAALASGPTTFGTKVASRADRAYHLWRGYPAATGIDPDLPQGQAPQYPTYEGEGQVAAAMLYALTLNGQHADAVKAALLGQVRLRQSGATAGFIGAYADELPAPPLTNRGPARPTSFSFSNEAVWIDRLGQAFSLCRDRFSPSEQAEFLAWHNAWADYLASVMERRFAAFDLPGYLSLDLSVRRGIYADSFPLGTSLKVAYYNAQGAPGPLITPAGPVFGNVYATFIGALACNYLISGRVAMIQAIRAWYNAWLTFSVYPDGTTAEATRNDDYGHPGRGSIWYQRIVTETACKAELMIRQRGATMLDITTIGGHPQTRVPTGGQPKSLKLVIDRSLKYYTGEEPRYDRLPIGAATQIRSPYVGTPPSEYGDDFETGAPSLFGMAYQLFGEEAYRQASRHMLPGMAPLPASGYSASRTLESWFNGSTNDIYPGVYGVWSRIDVRSAYSL